MTASTQPIITRIMVKRVRINQNTNTVRGSTSYGDFSAFFIGNKIRDYLCVKPTSALMVNYREDPFDPSNTELFTTYGFVDFTGIDSLDNDGFEYRQALLGGEEVIISINEHINWVLSLQERTTNLLHNSSSSETAYYFPKEHPLNPRSNIYNSYNDDRIHMFDNPFCAGDEDPRMGYRDAYTSWTFEGDEP